MNRDDLDHETERTRLEEELAAAKAACDGSDEARAGLAAAKKAISDFRTAERQTRVPTDAAPGDGVAAPDTVQVTTSTEGG